MYSTVCAVVPCVCDLLLLLRMRMEKKNKLRRSSFFAVSSDELHPHPPSVDTLSSLLVFILCVKTLPMLA
jgi:hypothetical protein